MTKRLAVLVCVLMSLLVGLFFHLAPPWMIHRMHLRTARFLRAHPAYTQWMHWTTVGILWRIDNFLNPPVIVRGVYWSSAQVRIVKDRVHRVYLGRMVDHLIKGQLKDLPVDYCNLVSPILNIEIRQLRARDPHSEVPEWIEADVITGTCHLAVKKWSDKWETIDYAPCEPRWK